MESSVVRSLLRTNDLFDVLICFKWRWSLWRQPRQCEMSYFITKGQRAHMRAHTSSVWQWHVLIEKILQRTIFPRTRMDGNIQQRMHEWSLHALNSFTVGWIRIWNSRKSQAHTYILGGLRPPPLSCNTLDHIELNAPRRRPRFLRASDLFVIADHTSIHAKRTLGLLPVFASSFFNWIINHVRGKPCISCYINMVLG